MGSGQNPPKSNEGVFAQSTDAGGIKPPKPHDCPKAAAEKKAWGLAPQTPPSLAPDRRGGGATAGSGVEEEGRGPPDDGSAGAGAPSDGADCATTRSGEESST